MTTKLVEKMVEVHLVIGNNEYVTQLNESRIHTRQQLQIAFLDQPARAFVIRDVSVNGSIALTLDPVEHLGMFGSNCPLARRVS